MAPIRFAHKKAGGSVKNQHGRPGKRLGWKIGDGQYVKPGQVLVTQKGMKYRPSFNVGMGRNSSLYAVRHGWVKIVFDEELGRHFVMVAQDFDAVDPNLMTDSYKLQRIPGTQVTRIPKIKNFQIVYQVDQRNLGPKTKFRVNYPPPVVEPPRDNLGAPIWKPKRPAHRQPRRKSRLWGKR